MKALASALAIAISVTASTAALADEPIAPGAPPAPAAPAAPAAASVASAAAAPEAAASTAPPGATSTPLHVRPQKPLTLAPANEGTPVGYKLLAGAVVAAAAGLWLKKRKGGLTSGKAKKRSAIDILGRASIGVRNELLVVDVEGTRLLVGMTPGSMQTLAVLQTPEGVIGEESPLMGEEAYMDALPGPAQVTTTVTVAPRRSAPELRRDAHGAYDDDPEDEVEELSDRVRSLLDARKAAAAKKTEARANAAPTTRRAARPLPAPAPKARVPGQAKGLLLSLKENADPRDVTKLGDW